MLRLFLICLHLALGLQFSKAETIGATTTVIKEVNAKFDGRERRIVVGDAVQANELLRTGTDSSTQLKFLDDTVITIGAGAVVVLDKFIYNPDKSVQSAVVKITKGTMRFVTGRSSPENFTLQSSSATIGIRGTDVTIVVDQGNTSVAVNSGNVIVAPGVGPGVNGQNVGNAPNSVKLDNKTNFTTVAPNGTTSGPQSVPPSTVTSLNTAVAEGKSGVTVAGLVSQASAAPAVNSAAPGNSAQNANPKTNSTDTQTGDQPTDDSSSNKNTNSFVLTPVVSGGSGAGAASP